MKTTTRSLSQLLNTMFMLVLFLSATSNLSLGQDVNLDLVSSSIEVDAARLNLFPEQYRGKTLYFTCLKFGGLEKDRGVFCLRITNLGTYFVPMLHRDGITFVTSSRIASQVLATYISSSERESCQIQIGFRVEQVEGYWIGRVFEIGISSGGFGVGEVISDDPDTSM